MAAPLPQTKPQWVMHRQEHRQEHRAGRCEGLEEEEEEGGEGGGGIPR